MDNEWEDVKSFVVYVLKNYGGYYLGYLFLEEVAKRGFLYRDSFMKFLELEKLIRFWGCDRIFECSFFFVELYYELGLCLFNLFMMFEFMYEVFYYFVKIIELVVLDYFMNLDVYWVKIKSSFLVGEIF